MKSKRKFLSIFAILFALVFALSVCFFAACGKKDDDEKDDDTTTEQDENIGSTGGTEGSESESGDTATVTDVTVTPTTLSLVIGETDTGTLTASVTMSNKNPYSGTYVWTSSNADVATVSDSTTNTATVTAVAVGTAEVTVTAGGKSATCAVTVSEPEPVVTSVTTADELTTALSGGGAIKLADNIVGMFTVSADTTLDLAGYSITDTAVATTADVENETTQYTVTVDEGASLTVTDSSEEGSGSIVCTYTPTAIKDETTNKNVFSANENSHEGAAIYTCGTLNVEGGNIESSSVGILAEGGTATITGGTINTEYYTIFEAHGTVEVNVGGDAVVTGTRGIYVGGDAYYGYGLASETSSWDNDAECTLNVYGDALISTTFGSAISTLGYTGMNTAEINISGGTISGRPVEYDADETTEQVTVMPAIYLPNGILNISGGTVEGTTAVEVRGGTATITDGTIKTTAGATNTPAWNGSGATSYGYAIAVYSYNTVNRPDTNQAIDNSLNVTVSGGTIDGPLCDTYTEGADVPEYTFSITGGTFSEDIESEYLDVENYHTELQKDGTYKVAAGVAGRNVEGMITADAYVASQQDMGDGTTLDSQKKELMSGGGTTVSFYGDTGESPSAKISRKNRTSTDGYLFTFAIQLRTASVNTNSPSNCIEVTVTQACTVTVYVLSSGSDTRTLGTWTKSDNTYTQDEATYSVGADANENFVPIEISFTTAGTYIIGSTSGIINFYGLMFGTVAA